MHTTSFLVFLFTDLYSAVAVCYVVVNRLTTKAEEHGRSTQKEQSNFWVLSVYI